MIYITKSMITRTNRYSHNSLNISLQTHSQKNDHLNATLL